MNRFTDELDYNQQVIAARVKLNDLTLQGQAEQDRQKRIDKIVKELTKSKYQHGRFCPCLFCSGKNKTI